MIWDYPAWWNAREKHGFKVFNMLVVKGEQMDHFGSFVNNGFWEQTQNHFILIANLALKHLRTHLGFSLRRGVELLLRVHVISIEPLNTCGEPPQWLQSRVKTKCSVCVRCLNNFNWNWFVAFGDRKTTLNLHARDQCIWKIESALGNSMPKKIKMNNRPHIPFMKLLYGHGSTILLALRRRGHFIVFNIHSWRKPGSRNLTYPWPADFVSQTRLSPWRSIAPNRFGTLRLRQMPTWTATMPAPRSLRARPRGLGWLDIYFDGHFGV